MPWASGSPPAPHLTARRRGAQHPSQSFHRHCGRYYSSIKNNMGPSAFQSRIMMLNLVLPPETSGDSPRRNLLSLVRIFPRRVCSAQALYAVLESPDINKIVADSPPGVDGPVQEWGREPDRDTEEHPLRGWRPRGFAGWPGCFEGGHPWCHLNRDLWSRQGVAGVGGRDEDVRQSKSAWAEGPKQRAPGKGPLPHQGPKWRARGRDGRSEGTREECQAGEEARAKGLERCLHDQDFDCLSQEPQEAMFKAASEQCGQNFQEKRSLWPQRGGRK